MLVQSSNATTSAVRDGRVHFETSAGATWSVPLMDSVGTVTMHEGNGRRRYHQLFDLEDWEKKEWPWATHRMSLTPSYDQTSPLFSSCPVGIKEGTKYQMLLNLEGESRTPDDQWKVEAFTFREYPKTTAA